MPKQEQKQSGSSICHVMHGMKNNNGGTPLMWQFGGGYVELNDNGTPTSWNYYVTDHLGSITHILKSDCTLQQQLSYDAWGRLRNPQTHALYAPGSEPTLFLGRGYCGHEHMQELGLINMNARLYDPYLGRFLTPDNYVQLPDFSQSFNRYSYCLNNPLKYTDPH